MEQIGIATVNYDEAGNVVSANFEPKLKVENVDVKQLLSIKADPDVDVVKHNAEMVMASWFTKINDIELADRDDYNIVSEVLRCERYDNDKIKTCSIAFYFDLVKR